MPTRLPTYTDKFKVAVLKELEKGRKIYDVAPVYGPNPHTIYKWIRRALKGGFKGYTPGPELAKSIRKIHPLPFKLAAVRRVAVGENFLRVAADIGVCDQTLRTWYARLKTSDKPLRPQKDSPAANRASAKLKAMDQKIMSTEEKLQEAIRAKADRTTQMVADPLVWLQKYTETKDSHWRERGAEAPYRPFPDKPFFRPLIEDWQREPVVFIEKSRNMMLSWLCVGFFTHAAMTTPGIEILFQSQKEDKAFELVDYAKVLYDHQPGELQAEFPLVKKLKDMADGELHFANGSRIIGIPGGADQIRSYHPWGLLMDEAAFMPEAGDCYNNAIPVCRKILMVSSAGPGWFGETCNSGLPLAMNSPLQGFVRKRSPQGLIQRVHYSADPERGPEWVAEERKKYSSQSKWDREQEIVHEAGGGERIFAEVLGRWKDKILIDPGESGFQVPPHWKRISAFDHGKANPTAALVACVDHDGVLYILSEYYQPGLSPRQHRPNLTELEGFLQSEALADPSIFYKTQAQSDGSFKAIADLYIEEGIRNLAPAPNNSELTGMERILNHWLDLDNREPTLKIVCPRSLRDISRPIYGVHNEGCPNLLWEMRRARREELSSGQLVHKNPTERIVDKDNHLRDCLKYLCLAFLEPSQLTPEMRANEAIKHIPKDDPTSRMIRWQIAMENAKAADTAQPIPIGRRGRVHMARHNQFDNRRMRNLFRDPV
ncbi:MAG TPA: transposase [Candidatus Angelobacter sp.]